MSDPRDTSGSRRLVVVIDGLGTGGAERSLFELLPFLRAAGWHTIIVTLFQRTEGVEEQVRALGFDVRRISARNWVSRVAQIRKIITTERPDLVHTVLYKASVAARLAATGTRVPLLTSLVNTTYGAARRDSAGVSRRSLGVARVVDRVTARRTNHFHAISEGVADDGRAHLALRAEDITVIYRGRTRERLGDPGPDRRRSVRATLGLTDDQPVLLSVARQEEQKGLQHLVDAMDIVVTHHPDAVLLQAGRTGLATPAIEGALRHLRVPTSVRLLGHREDVGDLLAAADVFVFPSLWEGLGGALLEALAMDLPIVATDIDIFREVLDAGPDGNAKLVPPGDPAALAAAIVDALDAPERRRAMGRRSRALYEQHFTVDATVHQMLDLLAAVADGPPSGSTR